MNSSSNVESSNAVAENKVVGGDPTQQVNTPKIKEMQKDNRLVCWMFQSILRQML